MMLAAVIFAQLHCNSQPHFSLSPLTVLLSLPYVAIVEHDLERPEACQLIPGGAFAVGDYCNPHCACQATLVYYFSTHKFFLHLCMSTSVTGTEKAIS